MQTQTQITTTWAVDLAHSELSFKVKHLMISTVTGYFKSFRIAAETAGADFLEVTSVIAEADAASINTNNEQRDDHLRSEDFFGAEKFPLLTFKSAGISFKNSTDTTVQGQLTIKNITQPVELRAAFGGVITDGYGQTKAGLTLTGKISRKQFGITWSAVTEAGGAVVGDEVNINANIQLVKQST